MRWGWLLAVACYVVFFMSPVVAQELIVTQPIQPMPEPIFEQPAPEPIGGMPRPVRPAPVVIDPPPVIDVPPPVVEPSVSVCAPIKGMMYKLTGPDSAKCMMQELQSDRRRKDIVTIVAMCGADYRSESECVFTARREIDKMKRIFSQWFAHNFPDARNIRFSVLNGYAYLPNYRDVHQRPNYMGGVSYYSPWGEPVRTWFEQNSETLNAIQDRHRILVVSLIKSIERGTSGEGGGIPLGNCWLNLDNEDTVNNRQFTQPYVVWTPTHETDTVGNYVDTMGICLHGFGHMLGVGHMADECISLGGNLPGHPACTMWREDQANIQSIMDRGFDQGQVINPEYNRNQHGLSLYAVERLRADAANLKFIEGAKSSGKKRPRWLQTYPPRVHTTPMTQTEQSVAR